MAAGALEARISPAKPQRLTHFDWMRGLACVLMFQTHCYDAWLTSAARQSKFFMWSQLVGSMPAPLFLFLTGVSAVLMAKKISGDAGPRSAALSIARRGIEIWGLGMLFRLQEYLIAFPWAPWTDLLRVDVLNCIGLSLVLVGLLFYVTGSWPIAALNSALAAAAIVVLAPLVWNHHFSSLPWFLESYLNGVHNQGKPLGWLFPLFPWAAFAFAGTIAGWLALSNAAQRHQRARIVVIAAAGAAVAALGYALDHSSFRVFPDRLYDFWHTSSGFFLIRVGVLLAIVAISDLRCQLPPLLSHSKPLVIMGRHSLLVYWVHLEFVYGRLHILPRHGMGIVGASLGLVMITVAMMLLSWARSRWKPTVRRFSPAQAGAAGQA